MTTKEIINNNVLIAKFMGWKRIVDDGGIQIYQLNQTTRDIHSLKYNSSWELLMPVFIKIAQIDKVKFGLTSCNGHYQCSIFTPDGEIGKKWPTDNAIECANNTVIEFIKWYNNRLTDEA